MMHDDPRRWWALAALALGVLVVGLDATIVNVALPTLADELDASTSELQWITNAFNLVFAAALLPAGLLGDRFGRKRLLLGSLALFGVASLGCALASNSGQLIAARALLGLGGAGAMPLSMAVLPALFGEHERARRPSPPGSARPRWRCRWARSSAACCSTASRGARSSSSTCRW